MINISTVSVCDKLPDKILEKTIGFSTEIEDQEVSYIQSRIPSNDHYEITKLLHKNFPISKERQIVKKRAYRKGRQKRQTGCQLTSTRRRELGLHKLSRSGLKFTDLLPIHAIWVDYMRTYLGLDEFSKKKWYKVLHISIWTLFSKLLWKADYHGAYISVIRSLCPSFVGLEGILVMEMRNVFKIVSKDDITRSKIYMPRNV
ncbi:hypothetical protein AAG570_000427 [Ranatra chinensis]|uniref:Ribonuclease P protein subunit p29 n=1 Tax=Ranatra chinensis TaxID=642074 RepID=A0ABD0YX08_9HEMI